MLAALESRGIRQFLCVGDVVGYNADADDCVALLRARRCAAISGNHDLISVGRLRSERCSDKAMYALKRTRRTLAPESAAWLAALPPHRMVGRHIVLVHGGVRDVEQYMVGRGHIRDNADFLRADFADARLCFFGHSHEQRAYEVRGAEVRERFPAAEAASTTVAMSRERLYFVNPGSVDASRKRTGCVAECAILDHEAWTIEFLRVAYDAAASEGKARAGGYRMGPGMRCAYSLRRLVRRIARKLAGPGARPP